VRTLADFSWMSDDDAAFLPTNDLYQFENVASTYFEELLNEWFDSQPKQVHLTTKVTTVDQIVGLSPSGENMEFRLSSIVDLVYIGEEEIKALASTLKKITKGQDMSNLFSAGTGLSSTFTVSFSDPPFHPSKLLYTVQDTSDTSFSWHSPVQIGLIAAAIASFIVAWMILLWALGGFDRCKPLKKLRSHFYMHSSIPITKNGMKTKSTSDETEDGTGNAKHATRGDVEESRLEGGFEVSSRGVLGLDEMAAISQESQMRNTCTIAEGSKGRAIVTCPSEIKMTSNTTEDENGNVEAQLEDQHDEVILSPYQHGIKVDDDMETLSPGTDMPDSFSLSFGSEESEALSPRDHMTDISNNFSDWSNGLSIISTTSHTNSAASTKSPESVLADLITCAWQRGSATRGSATDLSASIYASTDGSSFSSLRDH
jgi:hypothetical protein